MTAASSDDGSERSFFGRGVQPGELIAGRYRAVRELGAGGMGQVLEVEHVELEKRFALKLIRPDRWDAPLEARFRREARSLARVSSVRVAQITDFGVDPDRGPFYVMELVDGEPLDALIKREGPLPHARALRLAIGIAQALVDIHETGIIHRDIKPGNIGVCARGPVVVRLLDFGLAASIDGRFGSRITDTKRVVGSMPYMAPEQFQNEPPSPAMDIWALGVVLYEMLSRRLPFDAPSVAALIHQILTAQPVFERMPRKGAQVLDRFLAKDPKERVQSAKEALAVLEAAAASSGEETAASVATVEATQIDTGRGRSSEAVVRPSGKRRVALGIGLGAIGVITLAMAVWWVSSARPTEPPRTEHAAPRERAPAPAAPANRESPRPASVVETAQPPGPSPAPPRARGRVRRPVAVPRVEPPPPPPEPPSEPQWNGAIIESPSR